MKKIKQTLNRNTKLLLKKLNDIDKNLVISLCLSLIDKDKFRFYYEEAETLEDAIMATLAFIKSEQPRTNRIIMNLVKENKYYIEKFNMDLDTLEKEYRKDLMPGLHEQTTLTPEMVIFHYVYNDLDRDEIFYHALDWYHKSCNNYMETQKEYVDKIKLKYNRSSLFEQELNDFYHGDINNADVLFAEEHLRDLEERYHGKIEGENITINHRILNFYDYNARFIITTKELVDTLASLAIVEHKKAFAILNKTKSMIELYTQIDTLKNKNDELGRDKKFLEEKLDSKITSNNNAELEKENYYLKSQVEKLQLENQELMQTIKELKEVVEDLPITIDKIEPTNVYEGQSIVVVGGHWSEKEKDNMRASYIADFIEAENIIKYTERIKNYDMIVFDTSRNSHINFNRLKSNSKLRLISVSKKDRIDELFVK